MKPRLLIAAMVAPAVLIGVGVAATPAVAAGVSAAVFVVLSAAVALGAGLVARRWAPGWPTPHSVRRTLSVAAAVAAATLAGLFTPSFEPTAIAAAWLAVVAAFALAAGPRPSRAAAGTPSDLRGALAMGVLVWATTGFAYLLSVDASTSTVTAVVLGVALVAALSLWVGPVLLVAAHFGGFLTPHSQTRPSLLRTLRGWAPWWPAAAAATVAGIVFLLVTLVAAPSPTRPTYVVAGATMLALIGFVTSAMLQRSIRPRLTANGAMRSGRPQPWPAATAAVLLVATLAVVPAATPRIVSADSAATVAAASDAAGSGGVGSGEAGATAATAATAAGVSAFGADFDACAVVPDYLAQKDCYAAYLIDFADANGVDAALDQVVAVHKDPAGETFRNHCHEALHDLAIDAAAKAGDPTALFANFSTACTGGFAHGVLFTWVADLTDEEFTESFPTLCTEAVDLVVAAGVANPESTAWVQWNCDHSIGHILYDRATGDGYDEAAIVKASAMCESWPPTDTRWRNCTAGFFMEQGLAVTRSEGGSLLPRTQEDVFALCSVVPAGVAEGCYSESGGSNVAFNLGEFPLAFEACTNMVEDRFLDVCYEAIGRMVTVYSGFKTEVMMGTCADVDDDRARERCAIAISGGLVMELGALDAALRVCEEMVDDPIRNQECSSRAKSIGEELEGSGFDAPIGEVVS